MSYIEEATKVRAAMDAVADQLTDEQAEAVTDLYLPWAVGVTYAVGDRRRYLERLYKCVQAHTSQADWTPDVVPALWTRTSTNDWPEWVQPQGAHDAYEKNAKVSHNGLHWTSDVNGNVWEPSIYGWTEAV